MDHLRRLGNKISVSVPTDENGLTGRECPKADCEGYFKIEFGTGLSGTDLPCHCPYCGHTAGQSDFWTKAQIEYAKSVALRKIGSALNKDLKKLEFDHKPKGDFGIGISMKFKPGRPIPIRHYREQQLETEIICDNCTLHYSVYGVFAFCPDCGQHNSLQILKKNLEVAVKMLGLAAELDEQVSEKLVEDALENCVSTFDGFGRELCRVHAHLATNESRLKGLSFQNLGHARERLLDLFEVDLAALVTSEAWINALTAFQKRHLLAHKMGVIDQEYVNKTGEMTAIPGRKVAVCAEEVKELAQIVETLASGMTVAFQTLDVSS